MKDFRKESEKKDF